MGDTGFDCDDEYCRGTGKWSVEYILEDTQKTEILCTMHLIQFLIESLCSDFEVYRAEHIKKEDIRDE